MIFVENKRTYNSEIPPMKLSYLQHMRGSRKFCQRGSNFEVFFFFFFFIVDEGREDQKSTISGPSFVHQQNAIEMAFR